MLDVLVARGIHGPTGDWRLITNRASALFQHAGVPSTIHIATRAPHVVGDLPQPEGVEVRIYPEKRSSDRLAVLAKMAAGVNARSSVVVLSGRTTYLLAPLLRARRKRIITDVHGAMEEAKEYPAHGISQRRADSIVLARVAYERAANRYAVGGFVVTESMAEYARSRLHQRRPVVFPCLTDVSTAAAFDPAVERRRWRMRLGLPFDKPVMVYSGGTQEWQRLDILADLFRRLIAIEPDTCLLMLSPSAFPKNFDTEGLGDRLRVHSISAADAASATAAGDLGYVVRDACTTNSVAFPNKYAEYLFGGLNIVTSTGLMEAARVTRKYSLGYVLDYSQRPSQQVMLNAALGCQKSITLRMANVSSEQSRIRSILAREYDARTYVCKFMEVFGKYLSS